MRIFLFLVPFLLTQCAFNKSFYQPDASATKTPPDAQDVYVTYNETDSVHGLFYPRENAAASLYILHGNGGNLNGWSEIADLFYQANFQVFIIDYPGYGNASGEATHENVFAAVDQATKEFMTLPNVADQKRILVGFSLGGNLAIKVAHDHPEKFDAMVLEGPFDSHKSIARYQSPRPIKGLAKALTKNQIDGVTQITSWTKPLLVIHSKDDQICPYEMGKRLFNAAAAEDKKLWTIRGKHLAGLYQHTNEYILRVKGLVD